MNQNQKQKNYLPWKCNKTLSNKDTVAMSR